MVLHTGNLVRKRWQRRHYCLRSAGRNVEHRTSASRSAVGEIAFDAPTTFGYSPTSNFVGDTRSLSDSTYVANIALLGSYIASTFAMPSSGHCGSLIAEATVPNGQLLLSNPHHA